MEFCAAIADNNVDLVIAGALEKETVLHPFLGNVARRLVREATCSVMLFTKPERKPKPLRRIRLCGRLFRPCAARVEEDLQLAAAESCERLYAIRVHHYI